MELNNHIITAITAIKNRITDVQQFWDSYSEIVQKEIPELNSFIEDYVKRSIVNAKAEAIEKINTSVDWDALRIKLLSNVKNNTPVNTRGMIWVDMNSISDIELDFVDDTDILSMYDNYDENSLKVFTHHRKSFINYVSEYIEDVKSFEKEIKTWIESVVRIMCAENVNCLAEIHYNYVTQMMKQKNKSQVDLSKNNTSTAKGTSTGKSKKHKHKKEESPEKKVQQTPVEQTIQKDIVLNGVNVEIKQSQQEFIKSAIVSIINAL